MKLIGLKITLGLNVHKTDFADRAQFHEFLAAMIYELR